MDDNTPEKRFRESLLAQEDWNSRSREKYDQLVDAMVRGKLTSTQRGMLVAVIVVLIAMTFVLTWVALAGFPMPVWATLLLVEAGVLHGVAAVYLFRVLRGGEIHRRLHPRFISGLVWIAAVLFSVHFLVLIPLVSKLAVGLFFLGLAVCGLVIGGVQLLRTCIEQSGLDNRTATLELMLRMVDNDQDQKA